MKTTGTARLAKTVLTISIPLAPTVPKGVTVTTVISSAGNRRSRGGRLPQPRCSGRLSGGFTLLEILVVLGIAALLLTLVPLAFSGSVDLVRSRGAARELAATLQAAGNLAVAHNRIVEVSLDAGEGRYTVGTDNNARTLPKGVRLQLVDVDRGDDGDAQGRIRFYPDGSSSGGRLLVEDGKRRFLIAVHWLLGRVSITRDDTA